MKKRDTTLSKSGFPYVPARLVKSSREWYIIFWAWDHKKNDIRRKRIEIKGSSEQEKKRIASKKIFEINKFLAEGKTFNREDSDQEKSYITIRSAIQTAANDKIADAGGAGKGGARQYVSFQNIFFKWADEKELSNRSIDSLGTADVIDFLTWLREVRKVGPKTRNNYLILINSLLNHLTDQRKMIPANPAKGIKKLSAPSNKNIPFTPDEQSKLEAYLLQFDPQLYHFTRFVYQGFLRPVDITRLKIHHVNVEQGIILVRSDQTKGKRQLPVVITKQLGKTIEALQLWEYPKTYHLFSTDLLPGPDEIWPNRVSERHTEVMKKLGIYTGESSLYAWKHTGNCNAYRAGVDIRAIQQQNRHASIATTEIYLRSMGLRIPETLRKIEW